MTKEELEKEAEKGLDKRLGTYAYINKQNCYRNYVDGYIDGAEPREKQIQIDAEQIRALQKQNGELTDELAKKADTNHQLVEQMTKLSEENAELKKELEEADNATDCFNRQEEIIAKAKQFIRDFLSVAVDYIVPIDKNYSLIAEAEQFLKENA